MVPEYFRFLLEFPWPSIVAFAVILAIFKLANNVINVFVVTFATKAAEAAWAKLQRRRKRSTNIDDINQPES